MLLEHIQQQLEQQKHQHVHHVQMDIIQQQVQVVVPNVQHYVMELALKQQENVQNVKLDMDFQVELVQNVLQELIQQLDQQQHV